MQSTYVPSSTLKPAVQSPIETPSTTPAPPQHTHRSLRASSWNICCLPTPHHLSRFKVERVELAQSRLCSQLFWEVRARAFPSLKPGFLIWKLRLEGEQRKVSKACHSVLPREAVSHPCSLQACTDLPWLSCRVWATCTPRASCTRTSNPRMSSTTMAKWSSPTSGCLECRV